LTQFASLGVLFLCYCPKPSHWSSPKSILRELSLANREEAGNARLSDRFESLSDPELRCQPLREWCTSAYRNVKPMKGAKKL
jgi:hypothetical protein